VVALEKRRKKMEKYNEIQKDIPISNRPNAKYIELAKQMDVGDSILFKTDSEAMCMANGIRLTHGKCVDGKATIKAFAKRMQKENGKLIGYRVWRKA
jgi:hypothetical protein